MKRLVFAATALLFAFAAAPLARADEIDDAVKMFTADDGLTAAEKLPALKALVEANKGHPKVGKLTAILKVLAAEAGEPVADGRDKRDPPAVEPAGVGGDTSVEATDARGTGSVSAPKVLQSIATAGDDDYVAILDEEKDSTPDIRTEDEKSFLYTIEDAQAAADAAATEALKSGTKPWMPPEEALKEADEAFKRLGPIPSVPKESKARIKLPEECVADDFLNKGTALGAIVNLRERMRFALGSMSEKDEKEFDRQFDKALAFPSENIVAWCTNALPIVSEITRLRVALVNEALSFDETLDEMNMARKVGNYEAAHGLMCSLSRTVASMKAIEAGMKELMPQFEALGPMPDPDEERKKAAKEYADAKKTIMELFGPEQKVRGWYEAVGNSLSGYLKMAKKGATPVPKEKAFDDQDFKLNVPTNTADFCLRDKIYIRPLASFKDRGVEFIYINQYDLDDSESSWRSNVKNGTIADDGSIEMFHGKKKIVIEPFTDERGKECIKVRTLETGKFSTAVYRYVGGGDEENLPGKNFDKTVPLDDILAEMSKKETVKSRAEDLARDRKMFDEGIQRSPIKDVGDLPFAKDVHYVLDKVSDDDMWSSLGARWFASTKALVRIDDPPKAYFTMLNEQYKRHMKVSRYPEKEIEYIVGSGRFKCLARRTDEIYWDILPDSKSKRERVFLEKGTGYIDFRWETPSALINLKDGNYSFNLWYRIDWKSPPNNLMFTHFTVELIGFSTTPLKKEMNCENSSGKILFKGSCLDKLEGNTGIKCRPTKKARLSLWVGDRLAGTEFIYKRVVMPADEAAAVANLAAVKFKEEAKSEWHETKLEEQIADADATKQAEKELAEAAEKEWKERNEQKALAGEDAKAAEAAKKETKEFHRNNIKWLDESIGRLKKQLGEAKTQGERYSLQVALAGAQADRIHEQDMIRAAETGEFHASRTPWDELTFAKFHEDVVREVQEIGRAEQSRKIAEEMASKLSAKHEAAVRERIDRIVDEDPLNAEKWDKLREQIKDTRMYELENDPSRKAAFERSDRLDKIVTGLEYTKAGCEVAVSIGCGGAGWNAAKVVGCVYMATTGYMDGGLTNAFKKTVTFAYNSVQVASDFIDGCVEGGFTNGLARGEISFALNYGVPFLLDKMKGPPDGTGCHNAFDLEKLRKWNPKAATRKPRIADINAEYFETKYSKKLIEGFKEKKAALDGLNALTKTKKVDTKTIVRVKKEYYNALGKVNECPMAKAQLKYNKQYLNDGTSKDFAECCDRWQNAVKKKAMINMQVKRGYNKQNLLDFRNEASRGTVGMDLDIGLDETPNVTVMRGGKEVKEFQITRNGQRVTKYQWAEDMQEEVNKLVKMSTGCSAQKQYVNVTHSGHPEAFKRVELLKNSKNEEYMRSIFAHSRPSEVEQAFDVSRFKADEMAHVKGHPEIMGRYEQYRGWAKDYENIYGPALHGEVKALKAERARLAKFGRDLPKRDIVRCDRLEETMKTYDKIYRVSKSVGNLETPIYMANIELQRITDKEIPELITDLSTTFKALNIGEAKNQRGLMIVQPKNSATKSRPKALPAPKQPKALPAPEQPKVLPAPAKKAPLLLPWFSGDKRD